MDAVEQLTCGDIAEAFALYRVRQVPAGVIARMNSRHGLNVERKVAYGWKWAVPAQRSSMLGGWGSRKREEGMANEVERRRKMHAGKNNGFNMMTTAECAG